MDRHTGTIHMHGVHCTYKYTQHKISMPYKLFRIMRSLTDPLILRSKRGAVLSAVTRRRFKTDLLYLLYCPTFKDPALTLSSMSGSDSLGWYTYTAGRDNQNILFLNLHRFWNQFSDSITRAPRAEI